MHCGVSLLCQSYGFANHRQAPTAVEAFNFAGVVFNLLLEDRKRLGLPNEQFVLYCITIGQLLHCLYVLGWGRKACPYSFVFFEGQPFCGLVIYIAYLALQEEWDAPTISGEARCAEDLSAPSDISARNSYVQFLSHCDLFNVFISFYNSSA